MDVFSQKNELALQWVQDQGLGDVGDRCVNVNEMCEDAYENVGRT